MKNAIILHGTDASPESNWFEWLKGELEIIGYDVWLPELPNWGAPNNNMFLKMVYEQNFLFNEDTIIIGHASGAVAGLHLLAKIRIKIHAIYCISPFINNLGQTRLNGLFDRPFDYQAIQNNTEHRIIIHSDNDPYVPLQQAQELAQNIHAELVMIPNQGHFNTEYSPDYIHFDALLGKIKQT